MRHAKSQLLFLRYVYQVFRFIKRGSHPFFDQNMKSSGESCFCHRRMKHRWSTNNHSKYEYDSGVSAVLEFECGVIGNYCLTHCAQNGFYHLLIQTDEGTLRAYDVSGIQFQPTGGGEIESVELLSVPQSEQGVLNALRDYILKGEEPGISGRNNLNTLAVCQAVCDAAEKGEPVYVSDLLS